MNNSFTQDFEKNFYGMTRVEAIEKNVCIDCKQPIFFNSSGVSVPGGIYSDAGMEEYGISALCEFCFDIMNTPDSSEENDDDEIIFDNENVYDLPF